MSLSIIDDSLSASKMELRQSGLLMPSLGKLFLIHFVLDFDAPFIDIIRWFHFIFQFLTVRPNFSALIFDVTSCNVWHWPNFDATVEFKMIFLKKTKLVFIYWKWQNRIRNTFFEFLLRFSFFYTFKISCIGLNLNYDSQFMSYKLKMTSFEIWERFPEIIIEIHMQNSFFFYW